MTWWCKKNIFSRKILQNERKNVFETGCILKKSFRHSRRNCFVAHSITSCLTCDKALGEKREKRMKEKERKRKRGKKGRERHCRQLFVTVKKYSKKSNVTISKLQKFRFFLLSLLPFFLFLRRKKRPNQTYQDFLLSYFVSVWSKFGKRKNEKEGEERRMKWNVIWNQIFTCLITHLIWLQSLQFVRLKIQLFSNPCNYFSLLITLFFPMMINLRMQIVQTFVSLPLSRFIRFLIFFRFPHPSLITSSFFSSSLLFSLSLSLSLPSLPSSFFSILNFNVKKNESHV